MAGQPVSAKEMNSDPPGQKQIICGPITVADTCLVRLYITNIHYWNSGVAHEIGKKARKADVGDHKHGATTAKRQTDRTGTTLIITRGHGMS